MTPFRVTVYVQIAGRTMVFAHTVTNFVYQRTRLLRAAPVSLGILIDSKGRQLKFGLAKLSLDHRIYLKMDGPSFRLIHRDNTRRRAEPEITEKFVTTFDAALFHIGSELVGWAMANCLSVDISSLMQRFRNL
jgi:hypothetical protein